MKPTKGNHNETISLLCCKFQTSGSINIWCRMEELQLSNSIHLMQNMPVFVVECKEWINKVEKIFAEKEYPIKKAKKCLRRPYRCSQVSDSEKMKREHAQKKLMS